MKMSRNMDVARELYEEWHNLASYERSYWVFNKAHFYEVSESTIRRIINAKGCFRKFKMSDQKAL